MLKSKIYFIILFFLLFFGYLSLAENTVKTKIYQPYPIIFVSGIGANPDSDAKDYPANSTWKYILSKYSKYFFIESNEQSKYIHVFDKLKVSKKELPHLEFLVYDGSEQAITTSALQLKDKVDNVLKSYYTGEYEYVYPCNKPKVILICHSMGGLI